MSNHKWFAHVLDDRTRDCCGLLAGHVHIHRFRWQMNLWFLHVSSFLSFTDFASSDQSGKRQRTLDTDTELCHTHMPVHLRTCNGSDQRQGASSTCTKKTLGKNASQTGSTNTGTTDTAGLQHSLATCAEGVSMHAVVGDAYWVKHVHIRAHQCGRRTRIYCFGSRLRAYRGRRKEFRNG